MITQERYANILSQQGKYSVKQLDACKGAERPLSAVNAGRDGSNWMTDEKPHGYDKVKGPLGRLVALHKIVCTLKI